MVKKAAKMQKMILRIMKYVSTLKYYIENCLSFPVSKIILGAPPSRRYRRAKTLAFPVSTNIFMRHWTFQDVESALIAYAKNQRHRAALGEAVMSNTTAVDLSLKLYTAGEIEFLNLLTTQNNLYASEDALVQSDRAIDADLNALCKALGGGWQTPSTSGK
jgi:hypothetical protein